MEKSSGNPRDLKLQKSIINIHMQNDQLYSNNPTERLQTTSNFIDNSVINEITTIKEYYWFGSANAWLVFLGISPGNSAPKGKIEDLHYKSQISFSEPSNHLKTFNDKRNFWGNIRRYTKEFFTESNTDESYKLILTGNLVNSQVGDSRTIPDEKLEPGITESLQVISLVKPKIVICLQKRVYEKIHRRALADNHKQLQNNHILEINSNLRPNKFNKVPIYKVPVTFFQSPDDYWNKWILTRIPMHPSRENFCDQANMKNQFFDRLKLLTEDFINH